MSGPPAYHNQAQVSQAPYEKSVINKSSSNVPSPDFVAQGQPPQTYGHGPLSGQPGPGYSNQYGPTSGNFQQGPPPGQLGPGSSSQYGPPSGNFQQGPSPGQLGPGFSNQYGPPSGNFQQGPPPGQTGPVPPFGAPPVPFGAPMMGQQGMHFMMPNLFSPEQLQGKDYPCLVKCPNCQFVGMTNFKKETSMVMMILYFVFLIPTFINPLFWPLIIIAFIFLCFVRYQVHDCIKCSHRISSHNISCGG